MDSPSLAHATHKQCRCFVQTEASDNILGLPTVIANPLCCLAEREKKTEPRPAGFPRILVICAETTAKTVATALATDPQAHSALPPFFCCCDSQVQKHNLGSISTSLNLKDINMSDYERPHHSPPKHGDWLAGKPLAQNVPPSGKPRHQYKPRSGASCCAAACWAASYLDLLSAPLSHLALP